MSSPVSLHADSEGVLGWFARLWALPLSLSPTEPAFLRLLPSFLRPSFVFIFFLCQYVRDMRPQSIADEQRQLELALRLSKRQAADKKNTKQSMVG